MSTYIFSQEDSLFEQITPRKLAIFLLFFGICLFFLLYTPISLVFSGQWKLKQTINLPYFEIPLPNLGSNLPPTLPVSLSIRYYALFVFLGLISGYSLSLFLSKLHFIASTVLDRLLIGLVVFGILGARLFYVLFTWDKFANNPLNIIFDLPRGGLAIFGAILAGLFYIFLYSSRFRFNFYEIVDFAAPGLLLGQILGRWGNFFNYEAYGQPTAVFWKMYVPDAANFYEDISFKYFHPTFLYEIIPNFFLLICILYFYEDLTRKHAGLVFGLYCIGYGLIRTFVEFFRIDALRLYLPSPISLGPVTVNYLLASQLTALLFIVLGIWTIQTRKKIIYLKKTMNEITVY